MGSKAHKKNAPTNLKIGIITVSTSRTRADDKSGKWMGKQAQKEGHEVVIHRVIVDDKHLIARTVWEVVKDVAPHILLITGGTGLSPTDVTIEAVRPMFAKELTGFGALFAQLSFEEIDSAAIMSRSTAGIIDRTAVFCLPGSINACKLACKALIFPEAGHIAAHVCVQDFAKK
jgi:molybdenum cofactor biosynthesis protein B